MPKPFLWQNGVTRNLPLWLVEGMNNRGQIIGERRDTDLLVPVVWERGRMRELGVTLDSAHAINDRGDIVVSDMQAYEAGGERWFVWKNGALTELGTLGGSTTLATAINERGQVVGYSKRAGFSPRATANHAILWQGDQMIELGTLGGWSSDATAINNKGQIIGSSSTQAWAAVHAFAWQNGKMTDLGRATGAAAINDHGWIVGAKATKGDVRHAVLWRPTSG